MIENIVLIALAATFVIILTEKWGGVEWLQVHGNKLVAQMASCDFCLSWWVCVILTAAFVAFTGDYTMAVAPFFSTPITRVFL